MDKTCRLWDVQRGACIRLFLGHADAVTTMAISPDGKTLASAGEFRAVLFRAESNSATNKLTCQVWIGASGSGILARPDPSSR